MRRHRDPPAPKPLVWILIIAFLIMLVLSVVLRPAHAHNPKPAAVKAIRSVFGRYADQAIRVAYCETGGTFSTRARNGQYLGLFQMGSWERRTYAHGRYSTALDQARAAYRYFAATGHTWARWSCKP